MRYQDSIKFDPDTSRVAIDFFTMTARERMPVFLTSKQVEFVSDKDPKITRQRQHVLSRDWSRCKTPVCLCVKEELCVCVCGKLVFRDSRNVIPEVLKGNVLRLTPMKDTKASLWWGRARGQRSGGLRVCKSCHGCQVVGEFQVPEPMTRTEPPTGPWQGITIDPMGRLPTGGSILILVDY